jgi:hypothetical protein
MAAGAAVIVCTRVSATARIDTSTAVAAALSQMYSALLLPPAVA